MKLVLAALLLGAPAAPEWTTLRCGDEEVSVYRDLWGIQHIFAKSAKAAFWAEGYTEAEDRLWQMETLRRGAKGQAAELQGKAALANDRDRARRGYTEAELQQLVDRAGPRLREAFGAYASGVNAFLGKPGALPPQYAERGIKPGPWTQTDSMAIGVMMARRFGEAGDIELMVMRVFEPLAKTAGEAEARRIIQDLLRFGDPAAPTTLNDQQTEKEEPPREKGGRAAPGMGDDAFAAYRRELSEIARSREALGLPVYFGSNAWVAAPKKSASGRAMIYGGPMMGFGTPSICDEIHLVADGLDAAGMSFAGVPGVMIGWNGRLAWTTTSGGADLVDVYTLELNPDNPEEYRYKGAWRKFEILDREIKVLGAEPETVRVYRSVYGPLAGERDLKNRRAHTLAMSFWMKEQGTVEAVIDMNFARTIGEFAEAASKVVTSHNFFCATADGHIGFWYCGAHPVRRRGHDPAYPQDGGGEMEWEGILPFKDWPQCVDPANGFFSNWNNKPARSWPCGGFGKVFWGKKITDVLAGPEKVTFQRFGEIARLTAYHSFLADYFVPIILEAAKGSDDGGVKKAVEALSAWDHMEVEGSPCPEIVERWVRAAARRMFGDLVDPLMLSTREVQRVVVDPLLYVLQGDASLVRLRHDYAKGKDLKALVLDSLQEAIKPGFEKLGWKEPEIDFKGGVGSVPSKRGRGTFQMVVEMTPEGPHAVTLSAPGQSEWPESPHYKDQVQLFREWKYKPFLYRRDEMK
jgi:penicillin amidase